MHNHLGGDGGIKNKQTKKNRLSIEQLAGKFISKSNIFGMQVFGTHVLAVIYIGNQECILEASTIFYIMSQLKIFILYSPVNK